MDSELDPAAIEIIERIKGNLNPVEAYEEATKLLVKRCRENDPDYSPLLDHRGKNGTPRHVLVYCKVADYFAEELKRPQLAIMLLTKAWQKYAVLQYKKKKQRVYRAALADNIAICYQKYLQDKGTALRWALYGHADDRLAEYSAGIGAYQRLISVFGVPDSAIDALDNIAQENVKNIGGADGDWSKPQGFAEDVITRFVSKHHEFALLMGSEALVQEFPLTPAYASILFKNTNTNDKNEKGKTLEYLATHLVLSIPSWIPRKNVIAGESEIETDIVVRNLAPRSNLTSEIFGRHFLVECKNLRKSVSVDQVGYFLYRMRLVQSKFGIIFAKNDISGKGSNKNENAYALIQKAFHEDGSICVVINKTELENLVKGGSLLTLLLEKLEKIRFGDETSKKP